MRQFLRTRWWVGLVPILIAISYLSDFVSLFNPPQVVLWLVRWSIILVALASVPYAAYSWGRFRESHSWLKETPQCIDDCRRFVRFGNHQVWFDRRLVNILVRGAWLRRRNPQWRISRIDYESNSIFLDGGTQEGIIDGLVFSLTKRGDGVIRQLVETTDLTAATTRLRLACRDLKIDDQENDFMIDLVDPNEWDVGRAFELEKFIAQVLILLDTE